MENIALCSPKYDHVSINRHHARILCRTATVQYETRYYKVQCEGVCLYTRCSRKPHSINMIINLEPVIME